MKFRPLHDRVLIKVLDSEEKTKGGIIIPDTAKEKPHEGEIVAVGPGAKTEDGKIIKMDVKIGDRVLFGYDSSELDDDDRSVLDNQAKFLNQNPSLKVTIEGHCDERGTREYNLALGEKRASAVKDYLISVGINSERVSVVSYGKERPQVLGSNKAAWSMNRRSVTTID